MTLTVAALLVALVLGGVAGIVLGAGRNRVLTRAVSATGLPGLRAAAVRQRRAAGAALRRHDPAAARERLPAALDDPEIAVQYLVMPALCLGLPAAAVIARFLGASVRQVLDEEFVRTGVAKGLTRRRLVRAHVVPNALPPVLDRPRHPDRPAARRRDRGRGDLRLARHR